MKSLPEIQKHWLWQKKIFPKIQAWFDLIIMSREESIFYRGKIYNLPSGRLISSEPELSNRWSWSRTKVRGFLKLLEEDSLIKIERDNRMTKITILNNPFEQVILQEPTQDKIQDKKQVVPAEYKVTAEVREQEKKQAAIQQKNSPAIIKKTKKEPQFMQFTIDDAIRDNLSDGI
jgi:hypothetical protein